MMKFYESHFDEYVTSVEKTNLHPKIEKHVFNKFPDDIKKLNNVLFYGPPGVGKYSQMLSCLKKYSPSDLKYEKRFTITFNKQEYHFKISDVHYEVDMAILGCNSKLLWHDIYQQIIDVISAKNDKHGIIVCKNFHEIHSELLDNFYSYMQNTLVEHMRIVFVLISEHISFLPTNIIQCCQVIHVPRPSAALYKKCIPYTKKGTNIADITNIKNLNTDNLPMNYSDTIVSNLYNYITIDTALFKFTNLRELLYDMLIYDVNIHETIWSILQKLVQDNRLDNTDINNVLVKTHSFLKYFNNNYRPIYHLEHYAIYLIATINKTHESNNT